MSNADDTEIFAGLFGALEGAVFNAEKHQSLNKDAQEAAVTELCAHTRVIPPTNLLRILQGNQPFLDRAIAAPTELPAKQIVPLETCPNIWKALQDKTNMNRAAYLNTQMTVNPEILREVGQSSAVRWWLVGLKDHAGQQDYTNISQPLNVLHPMESRKGPIAVEKIGENGKKENAVIVGYEGEKVDGVPSTIKYRITCVNGHILALEIPLQIKQAEGLPDLKAVAVAAAAKAAGDEAAVDAIAFREAAEREAAAAARAAALKRPTEAARFSQWVDPEAAPKRSDWSKPEPNAEPPKRTR